jgi:hypothetical protein
VAPGRLGANIGLIALLLTLSASAVMAARPQPVADDTPPPFEIVGGKWSRLVRHAGQYEPLRVVWQIEPQSPDAADVFADPFVPAHVLVATGRGLIETRDHGRSWHAVAEASTDKIGPVSSVAFAPNNADRYCVGSKTRGLWQTTDGGKTFRQLASKATGLASDSILTACFHPADKLHHTILAIHGEDAPGLSKSIDNGRTWKVLFPEHHVFRMAFHRDLAEVVLVAATVKQPEVRNIYIMPSLEEPWQMLIGDAACTGSAEPVLPRDAFYLSTSDKGLFKLARNGGITKNVGPTGGEEWASLGATWGATADAELFYAYEPKKLGMVLFTTEQLDPAPVEEGQPAPLPPAQPYTTQSQGLFTGPLVMEDSRIQANANGTVFYAVVNKTLYVGQRPAGSLVVRDVSVDPPLREIRPEVIDGAFRTLDQALDAFAADTDVLHAARQFQPTLKQQIEVLSAQRITVTARIECPEGHRLRSVTVDLSRLELSPRSPLLADGRHNDGAAGDGLYANTFSFDSKNLKNFSGDFRGDWSGAKGLTVSAVGDDGSLAGAVGVFHVTRPVNSVLFWDDWSPPTPEAGSVKGNTFRRSGGDWNRLDREIEVTEPGPWSVVLHTARECVDLSPHYAVSFLIRASRDIADDVAIQFRDMPTYAIPTTTAPVYLMKDGLLRSDKITTKFRRVVIPVSRLVKDSPEFQPGVTHGMVVSSKSAAAVQIYLRDLRCYPSQDEIPAEEDEP